MILLILRKVNDKLEVLYLDRLVTIQRTSPHKPRRRRRRQESEERYSRITVTQPYSRIPAHPFK